MNPDELKQVRDDICLIIAMSDELRIRKDKSLAILDRALADPEPDALAVVNRIRETKFTPQLGEYDYSGGEHVLTDSAAAGLIQTYTDRLKERMHRVGKMEMRGGR